MGHKVSEADKTTRQITNHLKELADHLKQENIEQTQTIASQQQEIQNLHAKLREVSDSHSQQIDDIGTTFANFSDEFETRIENLPKAKANPVLPFLMIGFGALGLLVALGLNLEVQFGESKISYKGEGVTGGLASMLLSFGSGGVAVNSIGSIKELFKELKS